MATQQGDGEGPSAHDDVYAAVFNLVGQQRNETYDGLAKLLPSIKDTDPAELKELDAKRALREMLHPPKDPLLVEYEKAAAEEDIDDLSTEEGDWKGKQPSKEKEVDEEVDENGIPVMTLSRASGNFILDGPGDIKLDNFTPEADPDAEGDSSAAPSASAAAAAPRSPAAALSAAAAAAGGPTSPTRYVPSAIARAMQGAAAAAAGPAAKAGGAGGGAAGAAAVAAAAPVMTLEDEIRAMRLGGVPAASGAAPAAANGPQTHEQQQGQQEQGRARGSRGGEHGDDGDGDDEGDDAPEIVPEPSGPPQLLLPPQGPRGSGDGAAEGEGEGGTAASAGVSSAAERAEANGPSCLPGECQDTSREFALWQSLQGVDGQALLEHMGLAGPAGDDGSEDADNADEQPAQPAGSGSAADGATSPAAQPDASPSALPSGGGHAHDSEASLRSAGPQGAGTGAGDAGAAAVAARPPPGGAPLGSPGEGAGVSGVAAAVAETSRTSAAAAAAAAVNGGRQLVPRASSSAADGPTYEEVEAFSLDPDFDYDNVALTPRAFPYSMLSARWAAGAGVPGGVRAAQ